MKINVKLLFVLALILPTYGVQAQETNKIIPPAPNAASLGKYGDIPVNLHTGVSNISIPLHTISDGNINVSVSLNYHASGIRVAETASWVGLGWALNAGGMISRTVQHMPDEGKTSGTLPYSTGYYKDGYSLPKDIPLCTEANQATCSAVPAEYYEYKKAAERRADSEPDIFFFNFNGYSGKFMFDLNKKAVMIPNQAIKVTVEGMLVSFILTTPDGVQYYFGQNENVEYSSSSTNYMPNSVYDRVVSSWLLTKIVSPQGGTITFEYEEEEYAFFDLAPEQFIQGSSTTQGDIPDDVRNALCGSTPKDILMTIIKGKRLRKILSTSTEIDFIAQTSREDLSANTTQFLDTYASEGNYPKAARRLDQISIKNRLTNNCLKQYAFEYDYFLATSRQGSPELEDAIRHKGLKTDTKRLKLTKLIEKSCTSSATSGLDTKNPYLFQYNEKNTLGNPERLTRRVSLAQDAWGYYNGKFGNKTLVDVSGVCDGFHNRTSVYDYVKVGVLESITYPTQGTTSLKYDLHGSSTIKVGGLRIAEIKDYDPVTFKSKVKKYSYQRDELFSNPVYVHNIYVQILSSNGTGIYVPAVFSYTSGGTMPKFQVYSSSSLYPMQTTQGSHIGYGIVTVQEEGNGSSTYMYNLSVSYPYNNNYEFIPNSDRFGETTLGFPEFGSQIYNYPIRPAKYKFERGNLLAEVHYNQQGKKLTEKINSYEKFDSSRTDKEAMPATKIELIRDLQNNEYLTFAHYPIFLGSSRLIQEEHRVYDMNSENYTTTFTDYKYGNNTHLLLTESKQTSSKGKQLVTKYIYPLDYGDNIPSTATGALKAIKNLQDQHIWSSVIEQYTLLQNPDGSNGQVLSGVLTTYKEEVALPEEIKTLQIVNPIAIVNPTNPSLAFKASNIEPNKFTPNFRYVSKETFYSYDTKGNLEQVQQANYPPIVYLWGYNQTLPVAQITNAQKGEVMQPVTAASQILGNVSCSPTQLTATSNSFKLALAQPLSLTIDAQIQRDNANASTGVTFTFRIKDASGQNVFEKAYTSAVAQSPSSSTYSISTNASLLPGNYYFECVAAGFASSSTTALLRVNFTADNFQYLKRRSRVFYNGFEDEQITSSHAKTGVKSYSGTYAVPMPVQGGKYILTYWQKANSSADWIYKKEILTLADNAADKVIGTSTGYIDEVRLYPVEAQMTSFAYDPLVGLTHQTGPDDVTHIYDYDSLGRLMHIKDQNGQILKSYRYHYMK